MGILTSIAHAIVVLPSAITNPKARIAKDISSAALCHLVVSVLMYILCKSMQDPKEPGVTHFGLRIADIVLSSIVNLVIFIVNWNVEVDNNSLNGHEGP